MVEMVKSNLSQHDHPSYHGLISCLARDCFRNYFKSVIVLGLIRVVRISLITVANSVKLFFFL